MNTGDEDEWKENLNGMAIEIIICDIYINKFCDLCLFNKFLSGLIFKFKRKVFSLSIINTWNIHSV